MTRRLGTHRLAPRARGRAKRWRTTGALATAGLALAAGCRELTPSEPPPARAGATAGVSPARARTASSAPTTGAAAASSAGFVDVAPASATPGLGATSTAGPPRGDAGPAEEAGPASRPELRRPTDWTAPAEPPAARVRAATARRLATVERLFAEAGLGFPPAQLLLRVFKAENELQLWAASTPAAPLVHVTSYGICFASGRLGPKRREGDWQVPEGFYVVNAWNGASRFHLAMQVSYPNGSDRLLGDRRAPGGEIMIHGRCVSAGCLAMSDERIEELWVTATAVRDRGARVHVHIFPARDLAGLIAAGTQPEHEAFWSNLQEGAQRFERDRRLLQISVDPTGRYRFD